MSLGDWYLNGTKLCPYEFDWKESQEVVGADARMLSGALRRDIVARKLAVKMSWKMLPETFDGTYHCYNDLRALGTKAASVVLIRPIGSSSGTEQFTVLCSTPAGGVAFRAADDVYWDCNIQVTEV